jgi:hypothetical protein
VTSNNVNSLGVNRVAQVALEPVGLVNRAPHFYREAVESAERINGCASMHLPVPEHAPGGHTVIAGRLGART